MVSRNRSVAPPWCSGREQGGRGGGGGVGVLFPGMARLCPLVGFPVVSVSFYSGMGHWCPLVGRTHINRGDSHAQEPSSRGHNASKQHTHKHRRKPVDTNAHAGGTQEDMAHGRCGGVNGNSTAALRQGVPG